MRAMILAAGRGSRLRPLSDLRPKPALPIKGLPLVAYQLALLAHHGCREVMVNLHPLPQLLREAAERYCPPGLQLRFSYEEQLLDTGGAIRRVASFLRESDPCLLMGGDMLLDADLSTLVRLHRERGDAITLLLRDDPRASTFGTIGVDGDGQVRRIAQRLDLGGEQSAGIWTWANVVSERAFAAMPDREVFVFLDDWIGGMLRQGSRDVRALVAPPETVVWEPVGTPEEYLAVNLEPWSLSYLDPEPRARSEGTRFCRDLVIGAGATLGREVELRRAVVWDGETVPDGFRGEEGIFANGTFHRCDRKGRR